MSSYYVAYAVIAEAGLSFIGMGAQPPTPSLGQMIASGRDYLYVDSLDGDHPGHRDRAGRARAATRSATACATSSTRGCGAGEPARRTTAAAAGRGRPGAALLDVAGLTTGVCGCARGALDAVGDVSFDVRRGEILGLVGESGCGKSMTALTLMRLLPPAAGSRAGGCCSTGSTCSRSSAGEMRRVRGNDVSMVFQEPMTSLDPAFTIGEQIIETVRAHERRRQGRGTRARGRDRSSGSRSRTQHAALDDYPHQFSGGMRQRVMLAIALVMRPKLADRGRADDRARRDDPGADPRARRRAPQRSSA